MTNQEKIILRKLSLTQEWEMLKKLSDEIIYDIKQRPRSLETQWDYLKSGLANEGEARGVTRLIQEVHKLSREAK